MGNRFVILADVHLGIEGLQPNGQTYGDVGFVLDRAVQHVRDISPDRIILLGDLVNLGHDHEYDRLRRALGPALERCVPVIGNHELQRASIADFERNMGVRAYRTDLIHGLPTIVLSSAIEHLPDDQWQGEPDVRQLAFLEEQVRRTPPGPLVVIVHHPIAGTVRDSDKPMFGLTNSDDVQRRLDRHDGPVIVLSAHTHAQSFVRRGRFAYLGAPALGFWPHAFLVVEVERDRMSFSTVRVLDRPDESPDALARDPVYRAAREGGVSDQSGVIPLRLDPA
jgi:3',5'-cyclic AMP phosphodiesterase CpdA